MELKKYRLGDICEIYGRIGFRGYTTMDLAENENDGAITLSPSNIENGEISFARNTYLKWNKFYESPEIILEKGDVVLVKTGSSIGKTALVRDIPHPITLNPQFVVLKKIKADSTFLSYVLKGEFFQKSLDAIAVGSTIPTLSQENLSNISVFLPSIENQHCIAAILTSIDRKIALNRAINRNLEAFAKQLYDYWFVQFDFPDENGRPYKSNGGKMVWNEVLKREIPVEWEVKTLFESTNVQYGFPFSTESFTEEITDVPVVRIRDILDGTVSAYSYEDTDEKYHLQEGDVLVGMDGNFHMNYWHNNNAYLNQRCVRIRPYCDSPISSIQVLHAIKPYIKAKEQNAKGSTVGHLSDKDMKGLFLLEPKVSKLFNPRKTFDPILKQIIKNKQEIAALTRQRDELLPLLMNGQVEVKQLNSDL